MSIAGAALVAVLFLSVCHRPARATETTIDGGALLLWFGCAGISGFNVLALTFSHGSQVLGIAGAVVGTTLFTYAQIDDDVQADGDEGFLMGSGALTVFIGAMSYVAYKSRDHEILGLRFDPSIRSFDSQTWYGLQLTSSW